MIVSFALPLIDMRCLIIPKPTNATDRANDRPNDRQQQYSLPRQSYPSESAIVSPGGGRCRRRHGILDNYE
jgi:hypothetical protein